MTRAKLTPPFGRWVDQGGPADAQVLWLGVAERRAQRVRRRAQWRTGAIVLAAAACLAVGSSLLFRPLQPASAPGPLLLADGQPVPASLAPSAGHRALALADGSWITVAQDARLDLLESSAHSFSLALRNGRARFDIRPHGPRTFRIDCGTIAVEVVGTAFTIDRDAHGVRVAVERGAVLVRGEQVPDRVQRVVAGQTLAVAVAAAHSVTPAPAMASQQPAPAPELPRARPTPKATPPSAWQKAAGRADWREAYAQVQRDGVERVLAAARQVDELMLLADVARLSGHPRDAVAPLERIVHEHEHDPRAALSAFTLGRLRLDLLDAPQSAAQDIALALTLGLPSALSETAQARLVEAHARAGQYASAQSAAEQYRLRFAGGPHARDVDRWSPKP